MPEFADMASFMKFAFKEGDVVYILTGGETVLSVVLSVSCPMGYGEYVVMNLHNGETRTVTKIFLESAPEQLLGTNEADDFDNDNNEETLKLSSSRFKKCSEEDISHLQNASKSQKTHKMTRWGDKIFTGRVSRGITPSRGKTPILKINMMHPVTWLQCEGRRL